MIMTFLNSLKYENDDRGRMGVGVTVISKKSYSFFQSCPMNCFQTIWQTHYAFTFGFTSTEVDEETAMPFYKNLLQCYARSVLRARKAARN